MEIKGDDIDLKKWTLFSMQLDRFWCYIEMVKENGQWKINNILNL